MKFLKLIVKLSLFLPIFGMMVFVSYRVDPSGLFWGRGFERLASEYMLNGEYVAGYERLDGRKLNETYAMNREDCPDVLVLGSSRVMLIDESYVKPGMTFYNMGNVGADICDIYGSYWSFAKLGKEPKTILIGIDPWLFLDCASALDDRSDKELYNEFIAEELGYANNQYEKKSPYEKYLALLEPSYFQASVKLALNGSGDVQPEIVPKSEIYDQNEVVKCPDGSIIYDKKFNSLTPEQVKAVAEEGSVYGIPKVCEYDTISRDTVEKFERFIQYLQNKGIKIIFFLSPFHSSYIDYLNNGILSFEREELAPVDLYNEYVMTSLRTMWGMEKQKLEGEYAEFWEQVREQVRKYEDSGDLIEEGGRWRISETGWVISDTILSDLFVV